MTIAVVLFDLDDTLFAHRASVARGIMAHLGTIGGFEGADEAAIVAQWHSLEELHYHRYLAGELDFEGQRSARARDFGLAHSLEIPDPGLWFNTYFERYREAWHLHDDTLPLLDALGAYRLGIITNGEPDFQQRKLVQVGIADRFEKVIASGALGITKPDARIFAHAAAEFGVPLDAAAYIGDRFETDALGAANAGMLGIWLDRTHSASAAQLATADEAGVRVIHSLAEVPAAL
ncbi:HAD family hydrolase [Glaciihabitans arcticus]|uniref:HAD family hydrolase n=1 Tax=Glaciihabitans arcticus TaxID=2668039 RepID=A0A4Q9GQ68_9MICO|nr:HAD family hydrolase [Glaciihabitans arcticus]TBN55385.1 HAD family hydrolase [Glaciihabitans arcticus]